MKKMIMKGKKRESQRRAISIIMAVLCMVILISITVVPAFATGGGPIVVQEDPEGTEKLHTIIGWVAGWTAKIGLVVAFFGALQTVLGFMNDDADSKVRGLKTMAAGFMVWGLAQAVNMFF